MLWETAIDLVVTDLASLPLFPGTLNQCMEKHLYLLYSRKDSENGECGIQANGLGVISDKNPSHIEEIKSIKPRSNEVRETR